MDLSMNIAIHAYTYYFPSLLVAANKPCDIVITQGTTELTAKYTVEPVEVKLTNWGTWKCVATAEDATDTKEITISKDYFVKLPFVKVFGVSRGLTALSSKWRRTDDAIGLSATASCGAIAGNSDFDNYYPWEGITRETMPTGDVMVKIPKFWYKRYVNQGTEDIKIANGALEGFKVHPAFIHNGIEKDYIYVGAYTTSDNANSITGKAPTVTNTRAQARTHATNKGTGWYLMDIAVLSAIQMLYLVEYADYNVQDTIGKGYCLENSEVLNSGSCDNVPNLTGTPNGTSGKTGVVYRGIENLWGNTNQFVDGINLDFNSNSYWVCNNPDNYADNTTTNYTKLSYPLMKTQDSCYIVTNGVDTGDNPHVMLPYSNHI